MSLTAACVLRDGGVYDGDWVRRLRSALAWALDPDRFLCLSDQQLEGVETVALRHRWPGYWAKAELFRPGLFTGRVWYFDLDLLVVRRLTALRSYAGRFLAVRDHWARGVQSSCVMSWDGADPPGIYRQMAERLPRMHRRRRFDRYWNRLIQAEEIQTVFPGLLASYKNEGLDAGPGEYAVVDFHGRPKPTDFPPDHWVTREWERWAP